MKVLILFLSMVVIVQGMPLEETTTTTENPGVDVEVLNNEVLNALNDGMSKTTTEAPTSTVKVETVQRNAVEPTQQVDTLTPSPMNKTPWSPKETAYLEPKKSMGNVVTLMKLMEKDRENSGSFKEWHEKWEALWKEGKKYLPWGPYGPWGENDFDFWYKYNCPPYYVYTHRYTPSYNTYRPSYYHLSDPYW